MLTSSRASGDTAEAFRHAQRPARARFASVAGWAFWALCLVLLLILFDVPMVWLVLAPSKTDAQLTHAAPLSFGSLANYGHAFNHLWNFAGGPVPRWFLNSVLYAGASVVLALLLAIPAGYSMAVYRFKGRKAFLMATLIALALPSSASVLPLFLEMGALNLLNNPLAVILPSSFSPFGVFLAYTFFKSSLPAGLLEAGRVDGASEFQIFTRLALPLAKPVIALVAFFTFSDQWNNFFLITVMLSSQSLITLQVGLSYIMSAVLGTEPNPAVIHGHVQRPELALAALMLALPVMAFLLVVQRHLQRGLLSGHDVG